MSRVSNIEQFLRELRHDADWIANVDAPKKLARLTLAIRQRAEDLAPRASGDDRLPKGRQRGDLARAYSAGQELRLKGSKSERGAAASEAALDNPSLDKPWFIFNPDFISSFHEHGTVKMRATPSLAPAIQWGASQVIP